MPTLAPKLPWQHAFAGGYPRRGGQALPVDSDAIDYLNRVAAADGASVEVGIAQAIDAFVRGCKADGTWDAIQASCIMCGARTLSGALVPLKGTAPTPYNFASGDYSRSGSTPGLKGNGTTKYLNSNRANNADPQDDAHLSVYVSAAPSTNVAFIGSIGRTPVISLTNLYYTTGNMRGIVNSATGTDVAYNGTASFVGVTRTGQTQKVRANNVTQSRVAAVVGHHEYVHHVFGRNDPDGGNEYPYRTNARLAFYSIGSAISDLSLLDARVSTLVSQIAAAIP